MYYVFPHLDIIAILRHHAIDYRLVLGEKLRVPNFAPHKRFTFIGIKTGHILHPLAPLRLSTHALVTRVLPALQPERLTRMPLAVLCFGNLATGTNYRY